MNAEIVRNWNKRIEVEAYGTYMGIDEKTGGELWKVFGWYYVVGDQFMNARNLKLYREELEVM